MAWRIAVGVCIFGAGWYAVDRDMPNLLPRIDVAVLTLFKHFSSTVHSLAIEGKDTRGVGLEGSAVEQGDNVHLGDWKKVPSLLYETIMNRLIPEDLSIIYRAARRALQRVEWPGWMAAVDYGKACLLLLSSILCVGFATWYFRRGTDDNKEEVDAAPENPARVSPAGCNSSFGIFGIAGHALEACRHEESYIYSKGIDQLRREDAAVATIQRWARTEFKRWLRDRALSRSSIDTSPLDSQRWIDQDHVAVFSTMLTEPCVNVDALQPPRSELCSDNKVALEKCLLEIARRGGDRVDSSQDIRRRQKFSLSSKNISKVFLRPESRADPRASLNPVSKPP